MDLSTLNSQQRDAVTTVDGPLLLLAGAGTGKTRVIIHRIAYLIDSGVAPEKILAVTFTNKASREMRERVEAMLGGDVSDALTVSTFHSFCARVLRRHIQRLGYGRNFTLVNDAYQSGLLRNIMTERGLTGEGKDPRDWLFRIGRAKADLMTPEQMRATLAHRHADLIAEAYEHYQRRLRQMNLLDFDDLLGLTARLWEEHPEVLTAYQHRYHYLMVDEYQDTNRAQFHLVSLLAGRRGNLCVVGDDDQSIYGWRGADIRNILDFEDRFPATNVIRLEQNYRSTGTILRAANAVIANNPHRRDKTLRTAREDGREIMAVRAEDERQEASFLCDLMKERRAVDSRAWRDFAILFRSNHQSRQLEEALRKARIPYTLVGTRSFYQRKEVLDAISFLCVVQNRRDDLNLLRILNVPPRGLGEKAIAVLKDQAERRERPMSAVLGTRTYLDAIAVSDGARRLAQTLEGARQAFDTPGQLAAKIEAFLNDTGYLQGMIRMYKPREDALRRRDNVMEFISAAADFEQTSPGSGLGEFLEAVALLDSNDREESAAADQGNAVTLMTAHAAKGLEFPFVMVVGLERGLFPHRRSVDEGNLDEERRLFYVALTRAREELVLTYAEKRRTRGQVMRQRPSPFIDEIPEELMSLSSVRDAIAPASPEAVADIFARMRAALK